jgi:hypothetical protein
MPSDVTFVTLANNRADFLALQLKSFKKFSTASFNFLVLDNAREKVYSNQIEAECNKLELKRIKITKKFRLSFLHFEYAFKKKGYKNPNIACSYGMNWFWKYRLSHVNTRYLVFIDSDMFLIGKFNVEDILKNHDIAQIPQYRGPNLEVTYPWNGIVIIDLESTIPYAKLDWHPGKAKGFRLDVGGQSYRWLERYRNVMRIKNLTAFTIYSIEKDKSGTETTHVALDGNWNVDFIKSADSNVISHSFERFNDVPRSSTLMVPRTSVDASWEPEILHNTLVEVTNVITNQNFPYPEYFDLIGLFANKKFDFFIFHYKSGSNYQSWSNEKYDKAKTQLLENIVEGKIKFPFVAK